MSTHHKSTFTRRTGPEAKYIEIRDLPSEMRALAGVIGLEPALNLIAYYSGASLYIPKYESITQGLRNRLIMKEFDGNNLRDLSAKYNLSTRQIRKILNQG